MTGVTGIRKTGYEGTTPPPGPPTEK